MKDSVAFYMHAGSDNHGCEAIVKSLLEMLHEEIPGMDVTLMTNSAEEDRKYIRDPHCRIVEEQHIDRSFLTHVKYYLHRRLTGDRESFLRYRLAGICGENAPALAVSIGGDNYCYPEMLEDLMLANSMLNRQGTRTMLLGCSIEPETLSGNKVLAEDLQRYARIVARESITYRALLQAGIPAEKVTLCPDPAFALKKAPVPLPAGFKKGRTVGINVSPMIESYAAHSGVVEDSYRRLIMHILDTTEDSVALIPHVVWDRSNDLLSLQKLYSHFEASDRVMMIENRSAEALKSCIAACRIFVGARTHATIAAYSSCVPTLVVGYSVKARGIAQDIFGETDRYVIPVQSLLEPEQLIEGYQWISDNEETIREHLVRMMPDYIARAKENGKEIRQGLQG